MHGRVDILVNAAGLLSTGTIANSPAAEWERISRVNLSGVVHCSKAAILIMTAQRHGRIVNIASISAMRGGGSIGNTLYGASKAGVVALTMGLARELGPYAITANAVAPAVVDTAMTHAALTEDARQRILARIPLGRLATLSDIADLAAFLASARAGIDNGHCHSGRWGDLPLSARARSGIAGVCHISEFYWLIRPPREHPTMRFQRLSLAGLRSKTAYYCSM